MFGSDGTFDSSKFNVNGNYVSFFAPDVTTLAAAKAMVAAFQQAVPRRDEPVRRAELRAAQLYAQAISSACKDGQRSPATALRTALAKVN